MATTFKKINADNDVTSTKTLLHEAIPITSSIVKGTYGTFPNEGNIKNYTHKMFQSVYDYPYLSSSANHIFDVTFGYASDSSLSGATAGHAQVSKKINIYNQMAQVCMGYDATGSIQKFDEDGDLTGGTQINEAVFINFSRLLIKDEIKRGTFELKMGLTQATASVMTAIAKIYDKGAESVYKTNSPVGEYGILHISNSVGSAVSSSADDAKVGLIFYQAGICVVSASVFQTGILTTPVYFSGAADSAAKVMSGSNIDVIANGFRRRIDNISFNNTTELNSTIYFCRANHNEFNYSSNPTYTSNSKIRVKTDSEDMPVSYITSVGLYSSDGALLAVGKLSEPLKKEPSVEYTLRARLDY